LTVAQVAIAREFISTKADGNGLVEFLQGFGREQHGPRIFNRSSAAFEVEVVQHYRGSVVRLVCFEEIFNIANGIG
jgi:hypothetical protein|tara:strand:- start:2536 stop:2763 length:228 start_codon:yes stop_codon:yes gene_type:complete